MWLGAILLPYDSVFTLYFAVLGCCIYGWVVSLNALRYFESVETMQSQFQSFGIEQTQCYCCSVSHKGKEGRTIMCDKEVMQKCIQHWFGSIEEFEKCVQTTVKDALSHHLGTMFLPYPMLLVSSLPLTWAQMDFAAARFRAQDTLGGLGQAVLAASSFFFAALCMSSIVLAIRTTRGCWSFLRKILATAVLLLVQLAAQASLQVCVEKANVLQGEAIYAAVWLVPSMLLWWRARSASRV